MCRFAIVLASLVVLGIGLLGIGPAEAQAWPAKPIRLIVPFAPGGTTDVIGRAIAQGLAERLGQQVVVENRPGAGATLGSEQVARAQPDGYTLVMSNIASHGIGPSLYKKIGYDALADFAHIALCSISPSVIVVHPSFPARTLKDYVDHARANPEKLAFAISGAGSSNHMLGVGLQIAAGVKMTHIAYRGAGPAMADVINNQVPSMFDSLPSASAHIRAGTVRALAVSSDERSPAFPEVPTMKEAGYPELVSYSWFGVSAPARTPEPIVARLNREILAVLATPEVKDRWDKLGASYKPMDPAAFTAFVRSEVERWRPVVAASGASAD